MAEINDIVSKKAIEGIVDTDKALNNFDETFMRVVKHIEEGKKIINNNKISFDGLKEAQKKTTESTKNLDKLGKQLLQTEQKLKDFEDKRTKTIISNRVETQKLTAETKRQIIAQNALKGSYDKINASLNSNIAKYKALSAEERKNSAIGGKLLKTIKKQDASLKNLDAELGRNQRSVGDYGKALAGVGKQLLSSLGIVAGITAFVSILKNAGRIVVEFDKAQSGLAAILRTNKENTKALTASALEYGRTTAFTATEVTNLQTELAKLGFTQSEILKSTEAVLNLAAATETELADAAKLAGSALRAFNLQASESDRVASVLAVSTTKSALNFQFLETALSKIAPVAKAFDFTIEETTALLGSLADAGFDASTAATATRSILLNLADANGDLAKRLGGSVDSFDELIPALIKLRDEGIDLNETLQLTDKRSVAAFNRFLDGAESANELRDGLIGVNDELQKLVETKLDNVAGDVTKLSSAYSGFILSIEKGDGVIARFARKRIQVLTKLLGFLTPKQEEYTEAVEDTSDAVIELDENINDLTKDLELNQKEVDKTIKENQKNLKFLREEEEKNEKAKGKAVVDRLNKQEKAIADSQKKEKDILDEQFSEFEKGVDDEVQAFADGEAEKIKIAEKSAEQQRQIDENLKDAKYDLSAQGVDALFQLNNFKFEKELQQLQVEKDARLDNENLTLEERAAIEAEYTKKSNEIKAKQAKSDKLNALFQIAINTAMGVTNALSKVVTAPLVPFIIAQGAIQAALVAAQPIPEYAKGTLSTPERFIAGEAGSELMEKNGMSYLVSEPTYFDDKKFKGFRIRPADETKQILSQTGHSGFGGVNVSVDNKRVVDSIEGLRKDLKRKNTITKTEIKTIGFPATDYQSKIIERNRRHV